MIELSFLLLDIYLIKRVKICSFLSFTKVSVWKKLAKQEAAKREEIKQESDLIQQFLFVKTEVKMIVSLVALILCLQGWNFVVSCNRS